MKNLLWLLCALTSIASVNAGNLRGFYVGGGAGLRLVNTKLEYTNDTQKGKFEKKTPGIVFSAHGGYLRQMYQSKVTVGGEAFLMFHPSTTKGPLKYDDNSTDGNFNINHKMTLGGTLLTGAFINPKVLLYAKAGYGITKIEMKFTDLAKETPNFDKYNKYLKGPLVGGGVTYLLSPSILIGGEYMYHIVGKLEPRTPANPKNNIKRNYKYDVGVHIAMAKVSFLF